MMAEQGSSDKEREAASILKIKQLLGSKDDTTRFVGLALLKSVLDTSPALQADQASIESLWHSVSPRFLDRLLRTGSSESKPKQESAGQGGGKDGRRREMLDIAVAVLQAFVLLLPEEARTVPKLAERIPALTAALLHCTDATASTALRVLLALVDAPEGARVFVRVEDVSPLVEMAPTHPDVLDIFLHSWMTLVGANIEAADRDVLRRQTRSTLLGLTASFKGTDAVTLLVFLDRIIRGLDAEMVPLLLPDQAGWLESVVSFIQILTTSRPTPAARSAYTNLAASLLQTFPHRASQLLFGGDSTKADEKPFSYHFINLLLIDLRSSLPSLLERLNSPDYADISRRLASACDVLSSFTGFLVRSLDADSDLDDNASKPATLSMPPDLILRLRRAIAETLSAAMEHLRERWDAAVAGAPGLHPDARTGQVADSHAPRLPLTWAAKSSTAGGVADDAFVLAAVRALAVWLREDDNAALRAEAAGLCDMFVDLYRGSAAAAATTTASLALPPKQQEQQQQQHLDFRRPILVALEGITTASEGVDALLAHDGWSVLAADMLAILRASSQAVDADAAARGTDIVRVLLPVVEAERPGPREAWMDVVTAVAAWDVPGHMDDDDDDDDDVGDAAAVAAVREFQCAVLQLVTALVVNAHAGMRRRYVHSISAVVGVAEQLRRSAGRDEASIESLSDAIDTLRSVQ